MGDAKKSFYVEDGLLYCAVCVEKHWKHFIRKILL